MIILRAVLLKALLLLLLLPVLLLDEWNSSRPIHVYMIIGVSSISHFDCPSCQVGR